jgi:hypothetical protein
MAEKRFWSHQEVNALAQAAQAMPWQIEPADLQRRQLAPPETAVRQEEDGDPVVAGHGREYPGALIFVSRRGAVFGA